MGTALAGGATGGAALGVTRGGGTGRAAGPVAACGSSKSRLSMSSGSAGGVSAASKSSATPGSWRFAAKGCAAARAAAAGCASGASSNSRMSSISSAEMTGAAATATGVTSTAGAAGAARTIGGAGTAAGASLRVSPSSNSSIGIGCVPEPTCTAVGLSSTARRCMIARTGAAVMRSRVSSPTDLRSARIIAMPTGLPFGARTGRNRARRPSSRGISCEGSEVSAARCINASVTRLCSSGPSAPSLSHSTFASWSHSDTDCSRRAGSTSRSCCPSVSTVSGPSATGGSGAAGAGGGGRLAADLKNGKGIPRTVCTDGSPPCFG